MLRRFANFQIGALDANRLNEMLAAIVRLEQRVMMMPTQQERNKDVILARITGDGVKAGYELCQGAVRCVSYPFEEVGLAIQQPGPINGDTCVQAYGIQGGLSSSNGAFLLMIESEPTLKTQDVVKAHLASRADSATASDKGMVYIGTAIGKPTAGAVELATVISGANALYDCTLVESGEPIQAYNLYETNAYYGALEASVECATLSVFEPIQQGRIIWVFRPVIDGQPATTWVTMTPIAFNSECTCNTEAIQAQQDGEVADAGATDGKAGIAAHIMARLRGL